MPYYLASYIGSGLDGNPFRPSVTDPGWSAIDLRPDGGATLGGGGLNACLLYLPTATSDPSLTLIGFNPADILGASTIASINTKLQANVSPGRLDQVVSSLLMAPPINSWKELLPALHRYEIWLGGLFWTQAVISGGAIPATDNFNRADSANLGANWTVQTSEASIAIVTNTAGENTAFETETEWWNADTFNGDHSSQVTILVAGAVSRIMNVTVRNQSAAQTYYHGGQNNPQFGDNFYHIVKRVTGTDTSLSDGSTNASANDLIFLQASGSSLTFNLNGSAHLGPVTDTAITGGAPGIRVRDASASVSLLDNWTGDNLAAASGPGTYVIYLGKNG